MERWTKTGILDTIEMKKREKVEGGEAGDLGGNGGAERKKGKLDHNQKQ